MREEAVISGLLRLKEGDGDMGSAPRDTSLSCLLREWQLPPSVNAYVSSLIDGRKEEGMQLGDEPLGGYAWSGR